MAIEHEVAIKPDIVFAEHDGVKLFGDLYLPKGSGKAPVLIGVHGGGWQLGDRKFYRHWGSYLAKNGHSVFAVEYRLMKPDAKAWPGVVYDCKAAVQFVRANAQELGLDPDRIGSVGDSAGAHLSALVALAGDEPLFSSQYRNDPYAATPAGSKQSSASMASTTWWRNGSTTRSRARAIRSPRNYSAVRRWSAAGYFSRRRR
jgi:acetyl esterase/lipase